MIVLKVEFTANENILEREQTIYEKRETMTHELTDIIYDYNKELPNGIKVYLYNIRSKTAKFDVIIENNGFLANIHKYIKDFTDMMEWNGEITNIEEITLKSLKGDIQRTNYIDNSSEILSKCGMEDIRMYLERHGEEKVFTDSLTKEKAQKMCNNILCDNALLSEIERIFDESSPKKFIAHPVQYIIMSDNDKIRQQIRNILLGCLWNAGRLQSRRIYIFDYMRGNSNEGRFFSETPKFDTMSKLYKLQHGGTIILPLAGARYEENDEQYKKNSYSDRITDFLPLIRKYRHEVLSIIELSRRDEAIYNLICKELANVIFVKLDESIVSYQRAVEFLHSRAAKDSIINCNNLINTLSSDRNDYILDELENIYARWYDGYLYNHIYPCYRSFHSLGIEKAKKEPQGKAYNELQSLIGLKQAKEVIQQALDLRRMQDIRAAYSLAAQPRTSLHMVFTGNPGTAKTTVARLLARILKENNVLSVGNLIEVGRQDLVDRYVGGTAPRVKKLFAKARGSVLFIDEAYSLLDDHKASFGDEAINTIVQEMENQREEIVVIFAGYPTEMEEFLKRNTGLESRICFKVPFEDYTEDELIKIFKKFVSDAKMKINEDALNAVRKIVRESIGQKDAGNGRLMRNIFEKGKMHQASRVVKMPSADITEDVLIELRAEDFSSNNFSHQHNPKIKIGFFNE